MLVLALVVVGAVGYSNLGVDKFPKVDFPLVTIVTPYPGASPTAVETDVTEKVEEAVNTVSGLDTLTSTSTEGVSLVIAQFDLEIDPDKASQDINDHLSSVLRDLPAGIAPRGPQGRSGCRADHRALASKVRRARPSATSRTSPTSRSRVGSSGSPASVRS